MEERALPKCHNCGEECVVGYDDCVVVDSEYYCETECFVEYMMKEVGARWE